MDPTRPEIGETVRQLVDAYRDRCLWFLRTDYYPAGRVEILRTLEYVERYADREGYRRAAAIRQWLSPRSSERSAGS